MERVIDLTKPPMIGKKYLVRCVKTVGFQYGKTHSLPVIGEFHTDQEIIGFADNHIHIDWRFLSRPDWSDFSKKGQGSDSVYSAVISQQYVVGETERVLLCNRNFPPFPLQTPEHHIAWFPQLEKYYCTSSSKPFYVDDSQERCPHRGINLSSIACNKHGIKVCPAHGLQWDSKGELVPQIFCETNASL